MSSSTLRRRASLAATGMVGLVLAGCADADTTGAAGTPTAPATAGPAAPTVSAAPASSPSATPSSAIPPATGAHNDLDVLFLTDMIPHHRQAVEMADLAGTRAADPRVRALAARIRAAQDTEIRLMSSWLAGWGQPVPPPDLAHTAHGPGMMTHAEMEDLKARTGKSFDRMFCDMMVRHHRGALEMAGAARTRGKNPAVRALAREVARTQQAEVDQMRGILAKL